MNDFSMFAPHSRTKVTVENFPVEALKSAIDFHEADHDIDSTLEWIREQNRKINVKVDRIRFDQMKDWVLDESSGSLRHTSGRFFSIDGIRVTTNWGYVPCWDQPIINQPEIGYLGFIAKYKEGVLHFLLQAKIEPGNLNCVQLSPTIQATRSNYTQVHKGKRPLYLEYFQRVRPENVMMDQLQSEQGARFLRKRNRNIIILVNEEIPVYDNFVWLTLWQIKRLMQSDNVINMDVRTVLSGIQFGDFSPEVVDFMHYLLQRDRSPYKPDFLRSALVPHVALHSIKDIFHFLTDIKAKHDLMVDRIPLGEVRNWNLLPDEVSRADGKFFKVIGVNVSIENREVTTWQQPMIQPSQPGICAFICKRINGVIHVLVQAKLECGNLDIVEMAPTVQCLTGDYRRADSHPVFFLDHVLNAPPEQVYLDTMQSEEGGRFYHEQNRNLIVMADDSFPEEVPESFIWMTIHQLMYFNRFNNYLNIQARSLLAAITFS